MMARAIGFVMIFLGLFGLAASQTDRSMIEAVFGSETAEDREASVDDASEAEDLTRAGEQAGQGETTVVTELEAASIKTFERAPDVSPESLPWVDVSPGNDVVSEDSDHVNFILTLSEPVEHPIIIIFSTVDGSARSDEDYLSHRGTVTFMPGIVSAEIQTPLVDDQIKEDDEQFALILNGSPSAVNLQRKRAMATIKDND